LVPLAQVVEELEAVAIIGLLCRALGPAQWLRAPLTYRAMVVTNDRMITWRSPGATMDFALELTGLLAGKANRDQSIGITAG
jgi:hypothetical protein